jgi:hypothetical protein
MQTTNLPPKKSKPPPGSLFIPFIHFETLADEDADWVAPIAHHAGGAEGSDAKPVSLAAFNLTISLYHAQGHS